MDFFRNFPTVEYSNKIATNITVRSKIRDLVKSHTTIWFDYILKDGDRPDIIAHKYYGSSKYAWAVLYANDIFDPLYDWLLDEQDFIEYIKDKYGNVATAMSTVALRKNAKGFVIDETTYNSLAANERSTVTAYDYERELNEAKRQIKLIDADYIHTLNQELKRIYD